MTVNEKESLKERINHHPILAVPPEIRKAVLEQPAAVRTWITSSEEEIEKRFAKARTNSRECRKIAQQMGKSLGELTGERLAEVEKEAKQNWQTARNIKQALAQTLTCEEAEIDREVKTLMNERSDLTSSLILFKSSSSRDFREFFGNLPQELEENEEKITEEKETIEEARLERAAIIDETDAEWEEQKPLPGKELMLEKSDEEMNKISYLSDRSSSVTKYYDSIAFVKSVDRAVGTFDGRSSFLTWFDRVYRYNLMEEARNYKAETSGTARVTEQHTDAIRAISRLLVQKYPGKQIKEITDLELKEIAKALGHSEKKLKEYIGYAQLLDPTSLDQDEKLKCEISQEEREEFVEQQDMLETIVTVVLNFCCETKQEEYLRLLLTNDVLRPLKKTDKDEEVVQYTDFLQREENLLYQRVFYLLYLNFVFKNLPERNGVAELAACELQMKLNKPTIIRYREELLKESKSQPEKEIEIYAKQYNRVLREVASTLNIRTIPA
jgi:hypothetical protein